ncbi:hypothetical protein OROMI_000866 [Orobanche minor]
MTLTPGQKLKNFVAAYLNGSFNPKPSVPSAKMKLKELISFFEVDIIYLDNSLEEIIL